MKKLITIVAMAIMMVLEVGMSRLNVSAAEVVATPVAVTDDINGDGEVNADDVEAIVKELVNNPNTPYCVADWVRVSKVVKEKIGPALCRYDFSKMKVSSQNNELIINMLVASKNLKVEMENGITFTRSEKNVTEVFHFDTYEANPSGDINHIAGFTAIDEKGDVEFFEVGSRNGHYVLSRGLSSPMACGRVAIGAEALNESLVGEEVHFIVRISGDFSYNGMSFNKDKPLEMVVKVIIGKDDWTLDDIKYCGEAPIYEITAYDIPEGMRFVGASSNRDEIVTDMYSITGKIGGEMTYCMFTFEAQYNFSELEVNSQNTEVLEKFIGSKELKVTSDNDGRIIFSNNEETFQFDSCEANPSGDIDHIASFSAVDEKGDVKFFEVGSRDGHYVLSRGLSAPLACGQLVIHSIGASNTLDGHWTEFKVTLTGDFTYEGVSYVKEHPLVVNVKNVIGGEDWISGDIKYCGEAPKYKIEVINIPYEMKIVGVYKNKEIVIDENAAIITGVIGDAVFCEFVFDSENNSSSIQASFDGFEVGKDVTVKLLIVGDFTFAGKAYSEEEPFENFTTYYIPLCGLDPSYIHWETFNISWEAGTSAPEYFIEVVDIDDTPVEGCVFKGTLAENDGTRVIISNTTNR